MNEVIAAPSGWGWPAGWPIAGISIDMLPTREAVADINPIARNATILHALRQVPALAKVIRQRDLMHRYGMAASTAFVICQKAKA